MKIAETKQNILQKGFATLWIILIWSPFYTHTQRLLFLSLRIQMIAKKKHTSREKIQKTYDMENLQSVR